MEQGSPEWFQSKIGKVGASRIKDVIAKLKGGGEAASRKNYRAELVVARLTNQHPESFCSSAMQWGIDQEPYARESYEFLTGNKVEQAGFIDHPTIEMCGCSPDGLVGLDGGLEIKCPNTATHIDWLISGVVPAEHIPQMQWSMAVTGRKWWDFASYDPRMPVDKQIFIKRLERNDEKIEEYSTEVVEFLKEVDSMVEKLNAIEVCAY